MQRLGEGPDQLLLVNGYAATAADWDPSFLAALARRFEVICPDNRGLGDGPPFAGVLSTDSMAADTEAFLDGLEITEPMVVVGWSMGGYIAQRLTERSPWRVRALGLIGTDPGGPGSVTGDADVWRRLTDHSGTPRDQATRLLDVLFPPDLAPQIDTQFGELVAAARARLPEDVLSAQERTLVEWRKREPPQIDSTPPTAVIHGELDRVIPPANVPFLAERWRAETVEAFPGCAHAVMAQRPEEVAAAIAGLVD